MRLKELALHLGLSQTTVSRALNGYPEVNEETRQRVLDAARRYDYRPNASARRLATGRNNAIGIVLPTDRNLLLDPNYIEFQAGLGERLMKDEIALARRRRNGDLPAHGDQFAGRRRHRVEPDL
jgi:LacI family transcriptional regulator